MLGTGRRYPPGASEPAHHRLMALARWVSWSRSATRAVDFDIARHILGEFAYVGQDGMVTIPGQNKPQWTGRNQGSPDS